MKKVLAVVLAILIVMSLAACGGNKTASGTSNSTSAATESVTIKVSYPGAETHPWHKAALIFKENVESRSNGKITVDLFPNQSLAPLRETVEGIQNGTIEMGIVTTSNITTFEPKLQIFDLPYLFPTQEIADTILDGEIGDEMAAILLEKGFKVCSYLDYGFRSLSNTKKPITCPDDVKGMLVRAPEMPMLVSWLEYMGANSTVVAGSELFSALQQGVVDAQDNGVVTMASGKYYEVEGYMTETNHILAVAVTVFNKDFFEGLPTEFQQILQEECDNLTTNARQGMADSLDTARQTCKDNGMEFYELSADELQAFVDSGRAIWPQYYDQLDTDMLNRISAKVDELLG
ncbi:MAG: TRAP transporter substrate-binding protein [Oscillospiraceae bacterium]|nr:TRAP transporter substrate-binding protein [Oscillospiraceae bacterium]